MCNFYTLTFFFLFFFLLLLFWRKKKNWVSAAFNWYRNTKFACPLISKIKTKFIWIFFFRVYYILNILFFFFRYSTGNMNLRCHTQKSLANLISLSNVSHLLPLSSWIWSIEITKNKKKTKTIQLTQLTCHLWNFINCS